nr:cobalamin B12-binding domain-containing protein [uncultured Roseateles sp.]
MDDGAARPPPTAPHLVSVNEAEDLQLSRIVELEIIPRLMLMHSVAPGPMRAPAQAFLITPVHIETLSKLAVEGDADSCSRFVRALLDAGAALDKVFLDLLAPCAQCLGAKWDDDVYDFSQVTMGLWRLQQVLFEQGSRFKLCGGSAGPQHRALLAAVPGAQHTFGVAMVAEFFARAGWDVLCEPKPSWQDMHAALSAEWFDMLGLSISTPQSIPQVASAILSLRQASVNPRVFVMVGGPLAALLPDLSALCGADAMAMEANAAIEAANLWIGAPCKQA